MIYYVAKPISNLPSTVYLPLAVDTNFKQANALLNMKFKAFIHVRISLGSRWMSFKRDDDDDTTILISISKVRDIQ